MSAVKPNKTRKTAPARKPQSTARINVRLLEEHKTLIEDAAHAMGLGITDFTVSTLVQSARQILAEQENIRLANRDRDRFLSALESPPKPNEALRKAAERFKRQNPK